MKILKASVIISLLYSSCLIAGTKSDNVKKLSEVNQEIIDLRKDEVNKKYLESLEKLLNQFPKSDLSDQLVVQKEMWITQFLGKYYSANNKDFKITIIRDNNIAYQPGGPVGRWELVEKDGIYKFYVYVGDWSFSLDANQKTNYKGRVYYKGGGSGGEDGLIKIKK